MLHDRCDLALQAAREGFERTVAVLREENSTLRRMLEATSKRADDLLTELTRSVAISQPSAAPAAAPLPPRRTSKEPIEGVGNLLEPVPFGDPAGMFTDERAASLMLADDDDGVSHAA